MNNPLALDEVDARLFTVACKMFAQFPGEIDKVFAKLVPIISTQQLKYNSATSYLRVLLFYVSPIATSIETVSDVASALAKGNKEDALSLLDLIEDTEDLLIWLSKEYNIESDDSEGAVLQTADDLMVNLAVRAKSAGFFTGPDDGSNECLFAFVQAKVAELSRYHADISEFSPLYATLSGYLPFDEWYNGVIRPYTYYWDNYASLRQDSCLASQFLSLETYWDHFEYLVVPLETHDSSFGDKLSASKYLSNVILPFAAFHKNNLGPLLKWMYGKDVNDISLQFKSWSECLETISGFSNFKGTYFELDAYLPHIQYFIASCYMFGLHRESESEDLTKIYGQINETVNSLILSLRCQQASPLAFSTTADFEGLPHFNNTEEFVNYSANPLRYLFDGSVENSLVTLRQVISTCCQLYTINEMTILKYLTIKGSENFGFDSKLREVSKVLAKLDDSNYRKLLDSVSTLTAVFPGNDNSQTTEIDQLIVERLLNVGLFQRITDFYQSSPSDKRLLANVMFDLIYRKFWDLIDNSTNLDDRIGKLKSATQSIEIIDLISLEDSLSAENRSTVIKLKHLLKAFHNLKNFKLVLEKLKPITPKQILQKLTRASSDNDFSPISLIGVVLEQNQKSYLASERLYKIVNDLAIYLELDPSDLFLAKVKSACIESALVDNNFDFAYKQSKELFSYYSSGKKPEQLNEFWLTFYQVGKYVSPEWFNEYESSVDTKKIEILTKQRELLAYTLKLTKPTSSTVSNTKLIIRQLRHVNQEINSWYAESDTHRAETFRDSGKNAQTQIQENISGLLNDATHSTNQAGEKLSNLLVSGLGWAIGAKQSSPR